MRVKFQSLGEKECLELLQKNSSFLTYGNGLSDINVFKRHKLTKASGHLNVGHGIFTNILAKYGPKILPFVKKYLIPVAKEMGANVASDVLSGKSSLKKSLKNRGKESLKHVGARIIRGDGLYISRKKKVKITKRKKHIKRLRQNKKIALGKNKKKLNKNGGNSIRKKKTKRKRSLTRNNIIKSRSMKSLDCSRPSNKKMCYDIFSR